MSTYIMTEQEEAEALVLLDQIQELARRTPRTTTATVVECTAEGTDTDTAPDTLPSL